MEYRYLKMAEGAARKLGLERKTWITNVKLMKDHQVQNETLGGTAQHERISTG
jgi:hypothetical protein